MSREGVHTAFEKATEAELEPPRPLMREMPPADPYPTDALGNVLAGAARAIHDRVQAPLAICGQSVLAAATWQCRATRTLSCRWATPNRCRAILSASRPQASANLR
jgi:hypothetical protein